MYSRADLEKKKRIEIMRDKFKKGQVLSTDDFKAVGFNSNGIKNALVILRSNYALDILVICRNKAAIGWILADEIL